MTDAEIREALARALFEHDDYPAQPTTGAWESLCKMAAEHGHWGDCTNVSHSCALCTKERFEGMAESIAEFLVASGLEIREKREGWVLVPEEPTDAEINAGVLAFNAEYGQHAWWSRSSIAEIYRAMVRARPKS